MVKIRYIGAKPFMPDYVAHSGKSWDGNGDVQEVEERHAAILLKHPTEFEEVDADLLTPPHDEKPAAPKNEGDAGDTTKGSAPDGKIATVSGDRRPLEKMNKNELEAFALEHFGVNLDKRHNTKTLRDEVQALIDGDPALRLGDVR